MSEPSHDELLRYLKGVHPNTVLGALDIDFTELGPDKTVVEVEVSDRLFQHGGIVHGGVYVLLAESAASTCAAFSVDVTRFVVSGMEINANHLRPVTSGRLAATATPIHRGRTTHVYGIEVRNEDDRLISVSRCTIAIRPIPGQGDEASTTSA